MLTPYTLSLKPCGLRPNPHTLLRGGGWQQRVRVDLRGGGGAAGGDCVARGRRLQHARAHCHAVGRVPGGGAGRAAAQSRGRGAWVRVKHQLPQRVERICTVTLGPSVEPLTVDPKLYSGTLNPKPW